MKKCRDLAKTTGKRCRRHAVAGDLCKQHAGVVGQGGRPLVEIDVEQLQTLAEIQCTYAEMAAVMGVHRDTLINRFSDVIKKGREAGKVSLRRAQWKRVNKGSDTMQIFLGKNYLGQTDKSVVGHIDLTKSWRARVEDSGAIVIDIEEEEDDEAPARAPAALA